MTAPELLPVLMLQMPVQVWAASQEHHDERHLLTLTTPDELRAFRAWYLDQVRVQVVGGPPEPWPDYRARI